MDNELEFSSLAFSKILMHAMKYPHAVCSGLLLSPKSDSDSEEDANTMRITDIVPISHASHCLTPNIEIAYNSVNAFAQDSDLVISGFYQTDRYNETNAPDKFSQCITDKLSESYKNAVLCFVSIDKTLTQSVLDPHQLVDGRWKRKPANTIKIENEPKLIADHVLYTKEKLYRNIVDFDEHFNNISLDWTNAGISNKIDSLITSAC